MKATAPSNRPRPNHPRKVKISQNELQKDKKTEDKKPTNPANGLSRPAKPPPKKPDPFELQRPLASSVDNFVDVVKAFSNGTDDFRQLVQYECDLIFECKICRSLFRSLSNFIQHKKSYCFDRMLDLKKNINGEVVDKVVHVMGNNPKGQVLATRKTMRKDIFELLRKVGNLSEEPLPEHFFTRDIKETDQALLHFFQQEGKAATEERGATIDVDGRIVDSNHSVKHARTASPNVDKSGAKDDPDKKFRCSKCASSFSSRAEQLSHLSSDSCTRMRFVYWCPLCQNGGTFATNYNVDRHLRRVHKKTPEQVQRLQKRIVRKFVAVDKNHKPLNSPGKNSSSKTDGTSSASSPALSHFASPITVNGTFKRDDGPQSPAKTIFEVRTYGKTALPDISASLLAKQPYVILTKTSFPSALKSCDVSNSSQTSSPINAPNEQSECKNQPPPAKKAKVENDLSWLKRGPSVPIVEGRITRMARALYGSPKKNVFSNSLSSTIGSSKDKECSPTSGQEDYMDSENETERLSDHSPSDAEEPDSHIYQQVGRTKSKGAAEERFSLCGDNVRSHTSSVNSFDSLPSKTDKMYWNDRLSTSGVETDLSPERDPLALDPSSNECPDVDRLVNAYSKQLSPLKTTSPDSGPDLSSNEHSREPIDRLQENLDSSRKTQQEHKKDSKEQMQRKDNEVDGDGDVVAEPTPSSDNLIELDSDASNDCTNDDSLRSNMMEMIFGSLPSTMFKGLATAGDNEQDS